MTRTDFRLVNSRTEYRVITADPAWRCKDQCPGNGRGASKHYKTMTTEEICGLAHHATFKVGGVVPVELHMSQRRCRIARDAVLFLWRLSAMQRDALEVARSWGFVDKSEIVWVKYRPCVRCRGTGREQRPRFDGNSLKWVSRAADPCGFCEGTGCGTPWFGMGHYTRGAHETCLIATLGKLSAHRKAKNIRSTLHAPVPWNWTKNRPIHSAKPERFYTEVVQKMFDGPYLELFGRARRPGWTVLGNQVGKRRTA